MKRGMRDQGIAMVIVILVSVVALGAIVSATSVAALSSRQVTRFENAATVALMAAESGHNALETRAKLPGYAFDPAVHGTIAGWLNATLQGGFSFSNHELPDGAVVQMRAIGDELSGLITIESVGIAPGQTARRVLLKDYIVVTGFDFDPRYSEAALVTKTQLKARSAVSSLRGLSERAGDWYFEGPLTSARVGEYVLFGGTKSGDTVSGGVTYRVDSVAPSDRRPERLTLARLDAGTDTGEVVECVFTGGALDADASAEVCKAAPLIIPFAVSATGNPVLAEGGSVLLPVSPSTLDAFNVGQTVHFGPDSPNSKSAAIVALIEVNGESFLDFGPSRTDLLTTTVIEGTPVRGGVLSAIAEGGCDLSRQSHAPEGCSAQPLGDLWTNTFGAEISKTFLRSIAMAETDEELQGLSLSQRQYDHWRQVERKYYGSGSWPSSVEGLTWIDGAQTAGANNALCGSGIVVLNTGSDLSSALDTINLTTHGPGMNTCFFSGVLYIVGQLKLVGNLANYAGVVYVEGPAGITEMQGTGGPGGGTPKSLYNAIAVRDAFGILPGEEGVEGLFGGDDLSLRLGTLRPQ